MKIETMLVSEIIKKLEGLICEYGDKPAVLYTYEQDGEATYCRGWEIIIFNDNLLKSKDQNESN